MIISTEATGDIGDDSDPNNTDPIVMKPGLYDEMIPHQVQYDFNKLCTRYDDKNRSISPRGNVPDRFSGCI